MTTKTRNSRFPLLVEIGCVACLIDGIEDSPVEIHHAKGFDFSGMSLRACDEDTMGLCYHHHRGEFGYHKSPETFTAKYGTQAELLTFTNELLRKKGYVPDTSNGKKCKPTP